MNADQPVPGVPGDGLIRLRLDIAYDGRDFSGWAKQTELRTVQGELERILGHLFGAPIDVTCAGRTDAGVHARGQVAHTDVPAGVGASLELRRVNRALPDDIRLNGMTVAPPGFDARFSALWRRYTYRVCDGLFGPDPLDRHVTLRWTRPLDLEQMNEAAQVLLGEHDFAAFCRHRERGTSIRELQSLRWGRTGDDIAEMSVKADAFCHSMVRSLVGVLLPVGDGRRPVSWPGEVLARRARHSAVTVMPAHGLVLEEVAYPADSQMLARQSRTRTLRTLSERP
ncbi:MAG: tRNA pseudouridine(38-40) synthase TruA [Actinomycetes bacterium]